MEPQSHHSHGHHQVMSLLLQAVADVNIRKYHDSNATVINIQNRNDTTSQSLALQQGPKYIGQELLENGADVNTRDAGTALRLFSCCVSFTAKGSKS